MGVGVQVGGLGPGESAMKWTIRIELTPDGNPPISREIGSINRPMVDLCPEQVGLTLEEGH